MSLLATIVRFVSPHRRYAALTLAFGVLGFALSYAYPYIIGEVVDLIALPGGATAAKTARLLHFTELALLTATLQAIVVYGRGHFNVHLGHSVVRDMRQALFDHIQTLSLSFFTRERTGSVLSRLLHDVHEATSLIYTGAIVVGLDALQLVIALALLGRSSGKLTLACVFLLPFYGIVFWVMNPRVQRASDRMHAQFSRISANVTEQLGGQALIKSYGAEVRESRRLADELDRHHGLVIAQSHDGHLVASAGELLVNLATTIIVGYGGYLALSRELTPGTMTRCLGYILILFGPVRRFAELNMTYQASVSAIRRVFRIFDVTPTIVDPPRPHRTPPPRGHLRFEGVYFRYDEGASGLGEDEERAAAEARANRAEECAREPAWVLRDVSLEARPGERVAIVGPSGAGKTTLVSLVPRLYDPALGRIVVDGIDARDYSLLGLRSAMAIVQQDSFVFSGTVRDNIAYGAPDASDDDIVRASVAAHAHEFITRLRDGYESRLGERGVNLSGGQRQRISIARALLKDPRVLILDEATSSLDAESEALVQKALEELMRGRTCLVVAHRLSTIRGADRIVALENGVIAESGSHAELIAKNGVYARLVRHQRTEADRPAPLAAV